MTMITKRNITKLLKKMKSWARGEHPECFSEAQKAAEFVFHELAKSEDDKIREMLIDSFTRADMGGEIYGKGVTYKQVIAWLEKQGNEPNWCHHKVDLSDCSEEYRKAYYDGWNNCNQQHAQLEAQRKPTWSEEDEEELGIAIKYLQQAGQWDSATWLKSLKERLSKR